jgi:hypothetical protein
VKGLIARAVAVAGVKRGQIKRIHRVGDELRQMALAAATHRASAERAGFDRVRRAGNLLASPLSSTDPLAHYR